MSNLPRRRLVPIVVLMAAASAVAVARPDAPAVPTPTASEATTTAAATAPERPHDPFVFRCVLDDNPRTVVVALHRDMWLAYRSADGTLARAWSGDVALAGSVYDASHGPQPAAIGDVRLEQAAGLIFTLRRGDTVRATPTRWLGYRIDEGEVVLRRQVPLPGRRHATIEEMPVAVVTDAGVSLERRFTLVGQLSEGMTVDLELPTAGSAMPRAEPAAALVRDADGVRVRLTGGQSVTITYPALAPAS